MGFSWTESITSTFIGRLRDSSFRPSCLSTASNSDRPPVGSDASDPTGGLSLFDAVDKQLGLKLESRKRPMKVLVIDSVQEKPID